MSPNTKILPQKKTLVVRYSLKIQVRICQYVTKTNWHHRTWLMSCGHDQNLTVAQRCKPLFCPFPVQRFAPEYWIFVSEPNCLFPYCQTKVFYNMTCSCNNCSVMFLLSLIKVVQQLWVRPNAEGKTSLASEHLHHRTICSWKCIGNEDGVQNTNTIATKQVDNLKWSHCTYMNECSTMKTFQYSDS